MSVRYVLAPQAVIDLVELWRYICCILQGIVQTESAELKAIGARMI